MRRSEVVPMTDSEVVAEVLKKNLKDPRLTDEEVGTLRRVLDNVVRRGRTDTTSKR